MSVINDIFSRVTSVIKSQMTILTSFFVRFQNLANTILQWVQQQIQKFIQVLTRDPKSKKDYFRVFGVYISKKFAIISILVVGIGGYLLVKFAYPWAEGKLWYASIRLDAPKYLTFSGNAKVYDSAGVLVYEGGMKNGSPEGSGTQYDSYGRKIYKGEFLDGKYNGAGEIYNTSGITIYTGNFANNKYDGEGKLYNDIGKVIYMGSFSVGQKSGIGIEYDPETSLRKYYGNWEKDLRSGVGVEYAENGEDKVYEGSFKDGVYQGEGKLYTGLNLLYSGEFENGKYSGLGTLYDLDTGAKVYVGNFKDGLYDGDGRLYDIKTQNPTYEGQFLNGKPSGSGTSFDILGSEEFSGEFNTGSIDYIKYLGENIKKIEDDFDKSTFKTEVDEWLIMTYTTINASFAFKVDSEKNEYICKKVFLSTKSEFRGINEKTTAVELRKIMNGDPFTSLDFKCPKYYKTVFSDLAININNTDKVSADKWMFDKYFIRILSNDGRTERKCTEIGSLEGVLK